VYGLARINLRFERGDIVASTNTRYLYELGILNKKWGDHYIDMIPRPEVEKWMGTQGRRVLDGETTPETVNGFWRTFKMIMSDASVGFGIPNPCERIKGISTALHETYTIDEPNSLTPDELREFFAATRELAPRHLGFLLLGTLTGRRPCELRPLRATGADADLDWDTGRLLVRRSQTRGEPLPRLKQKRHVMAWLSDELVYEMEEQRKGLEGTIQAESPLLFPPLRTTGTGYKARSALADRLPEILAATKIKKTRLTPIFMRRSYQDLCRAANVSATVQKAMSGHATDKMKDWYSTAGEGEGRAALKGMCSLVGIN
jgi:hypothetical protein